MDPTKRSYERSSARFDFRVEVEHTTSAAPEIWHTCQSRNISLGGMFLESSVKVAFGDRIRVRFRVPETISKEIVDTACTVRWVDSSGIGLQFDGLRAKDVWSLGKLFEQLK